MTFKHALLIVLRAAEAHANGHEHCIDILKAASKVRQVLKIYETHQTKSRRRVPKT